MATKKQKAKTEKVLKEYKKGELKSSSGKKVTKRKQAVAIALSESGQTNKKKSLSQRMWS
jgi:hypothetical protein